MSSKLKNWITSIIGVGITIYSSYKLLYEEHITVSLIGFAVGLGLIASYNKFGKSLLSLIPGINIK